MDAFAGLSLDTVGATLGPDCRVFDLNDDDRVDLADVAMLQELFQD